ncbi:MAG: hypothetical protein JNJ61_25675 [Anaerolineae bacterium]|nr:hypothetical protein [Anaerolineae bacterium]
MSAVMQIVDTVAPMSKVQAAATITAVKSHLISARQLIEEFDARRGWQALGYSSLAQCLAVELGYSIAHGYRLVGRLRVEAAVQELHPGATVKEAWVRESGIADLPAQQQVQVYDKAQDLAAAERQTVETRHFVQAVQIVTRRADDLPYPVIAQMVASERVTAQRGQEMCVEVAKLPAQQQALVIQIISRHGLGIADPALIVPIADKLARDRSLVRQEVLAGRLNGKPLAQATMTDLEQANEEARLQHIADGIEQQQRKAIESGNIVVQPIIITVFKGDARRTLKALKQALGDTGVRKLFDEMMKE